MKFKLFTVMDKYYIVTEDDKIPRDYNVAWELDMSLGEYREILKYQFGGKLTHIDEDLDVRSNNIYFKSEEAANHVMAWIDSILVADRLRGKKKGIDEYFMKYLQDQIISGLGLPKEYLGSLDFKSDYGSDIHKHLPNKNGRVYSWKSDTTV